MSLSNFSTSTVAGLLPAKIVQVIATTKTDTFSASIASGGNSAVTGLTATITPTSTSSKILIFANVNGQRDGSGGSSVYDLLVAPTRGGTIISGAIGNVAGNRLRVSASNRTAVDYAMANVSFSYLDSPASTSSLTYGINVLNSNSSTTATIYVNRSVADVDSVGYSRAISSIILMEVTQ